MNLKESNKLYIGNLSVIVDRDLLTTLLKSIGQVMKVDVVISDNSRSRRCFAVVEMSNQKEADLVITKLNGKIFQGRAISVKFKQMWPVHSGGGKYDHKKFLY